MDRRRSLRRGPRGSAEAGRLLKEGGYAFDIAYTSVLKRAIRTLWIALDELDLMWIPVDEELAAERAPLRRAAGTEQGGNRGQARRGAGQDLAPQLRHPAAAARRRTTAPPVARSPVRGARAGRPAADRIAEGHRRALPAVLARHDRASDCRRASASLIAAHGNSLRALVKYLDNISEADIVELNIPTGIPLVYELDDELKPIRHYYLGDPAAAARPPLRAVGAVRQRKRRADSRRPQTRKGRPA